MTRRGRRFMAILGVGALAVFVWPQQAQACAVCFGDPESPMAKGAASGVVFLAAVVYVMLLGFASVALYWVLRARRMGHS